MSSSAPHPTCSVAVPHLACNDNNTTVHKAACAVRWETCADVCNITAHQQVFGGHAGGVGQRGAQLAALGVRVDVGERQGAERLAHFRRRPIRVLIGVQLDDVLRRAAQPLRQHLKRLDGRVGRQAEQVGAQEGPRGIAGGRGGAVLRPLRRRCGVHADGAPGAAVPAGETDVTAACGISAGSPASGVHGAGAKLQNQLSLVAARSADANPDAMSTMMNTEAIK